MSNSSAIAAVTVTLKVLLESALAGASFPPGTLPEVTTLAPRLLKDAPDPGLNLFLYHVVQNPSIRNLPADKDSGRRDAPPPLYLDLYYLLTACGKQAFASELLLGRAMQIMLGYAVLTNEIISSALHRASPAELFGLATPDLTGQAQPVRVVLHSLGTEEMCRLWLAFQAPQRLSVAYQVSPVAIDWPSGM